LLESLTIRCENVNVVTGADLAEIISYTASRAKAVNKKISMGNAIGQNARIRTKTPATETKA
jgi:hypothetical protein